MRMVLDTSSDDGGRYWGLDFFLEFAVLGLEFGIWGPGEREGGGSKE